MFEPNFKVKLDQGSDTYGRFIIEPLETGYAIPSNALRRVLSSFREPLLPVLLSTELSISSRLLRGCVRILWSLSSILKSFASAS